jgi:hypothetical protein
LPNRAVEEAKEEIKTMAALLLAAAREQPAEKDLFTHGKKLAKRL